MKISTLAKMSPVLHDAVMNYAEKNGTPVMDGNKEVSAILEGIKTREGKFFWKIINDCKSELEMQAYELAYSVGHKIIKELKGDEEISKERTTIPEWLSELRIELEKEDAIGGIYISVKPDGISISHLSLIEKKDADFDHLSEALKNQIIPYLEHKLNEGCTCESCKAIRRVFND